MLEFFKQGLEQKSKMLDIVKYQEIGFQKIDIEELSNSFTLLKKENRIEAFENPIIELVNSYTHTLNNVIFFEFYEEIIPFKDKYYLFGEYDENPLAINLKTDEVVNLKFSFDNILYRCALNSEKFLEATLELIHTEPLIHKFKNNKEEKKYWHELSNRCWRKAGGTEYKTFFDMICNL